MRSWSRCEPVRRSLVIALGTLVVVASAGQVAWSQDTIEDARDERRANVVREAEIAGRLDALAARDEELVAALTELDEGIAVVTARRDSHETAAEQARIERREALVAAGDLDDEMDEMRRALQGSAVEVYVSGAGATEASALLGSSDPTAAAVRSALAGFAAGDVADLVDQLRVVEADQREVAADAADAASRAAEAAAAAQAETERLEELVAGKQAVRREIGRRRRALEDEAAALRRADTELAAFITAQLAARAEAREAAEAEAAAAAEIAQPAAEAPDDQVPAVEAPTPAPPRPGGGPAGDSGAPSMIWPLSGAVGSGFGNRVHPIYGTVRFHAGLDISAASATPIAAAAAGVVLSAGWQGGYGETVIIDHGDGLTTVYPHMSGYAAATGDEVQQGQVVGYVGSTGLSTGPHLHFEVRVMGTAQDPAGYLP